MAVVYGQVLPEVDSVATYSARLRDQKLQEAEQRRQDRIAFGKALANSQEKRVAPITRKATKSERAREQELEERAKSTQEWKAWEAAREARVSHAKGT